MQEENIIAHINNVVSSVSEQDLDEWMIPKLLDHYSSKLHYLANKIYGYNESDLAYKSFREQSKETLKSALYSFIFKFKHWENGRDINTYLLASLNNLADNIRWKIGSDQNVNVLVCPVCKLSGKKEILEQFGSLWKCKICYNELNNSKESSNLLKVFAVHSRMGYRCPECFRFIPESSNGPYGISCPYSDCSYFGNIEYLEKMNHPVSKVSRNHINLQEPLNKDGSISLQDLLKSNIIDTDSYISINDNYNYEYKILKETILEQLSHINLINLTGTILHKKLMYEAILSMVDKYTEDMISYLVHRKYTSDLSIQSRIFQEYVKLIQNALPCTIIKGKTTYDIHSLTDPNLSLFDGISEFDGIVLENNTITNNTLERYVSTKTLTDHGPCFIGYLLDVISDNKSIKSSVEDYSFSQIKMYKDIIPGTNVKVKHYRIPSHYEIGSLVYLQKARKRIVDRVYFKIYGKKREEK